MYPEAEIFGGDGTPAAVAWRDDNACAAPISTGLRMQTDPAAPGGRSTWFYENLA
jgi:hypothetical protein